MSDVVVSVTESTTAVTVTEQDVAVAVTETSVDVSSSTAGIQGATGATGAGYSGVTSTSTITIGSGLKTFTLVSANQGAFLTGMRIRAIHSDTPTYYMEGTANYVGAGSLIITVDKFNGSGSHNNWLFAVAGEVGQTGSSGASGVVSVTSPITNTGSASSAIVGINQTLLSITRSQVSDFTSGTVAVSGTASYATTSGTATYATTSGTAVYATTSGTATYSTTSGTAVSISGSITKSQVSDFTSGTVTSISGTVTQSQVTNLVSDLAGKASTSQPTITGFTTIQATPAIGTDTPLTVLGGTGQAVPLQSWKTVSLSQLSTVDQNGYGNFARLTAGQGTDLAYTAALSVNTTGTAVKGVVVRAVASQSVNLQEWQDSAGATANFIGAAGNVSFALATMTVSTGGNMNLLGQARIGTSSTLGMLTVLNSTAANTAIVAKGATSQTGDLQAYQNSGGTVLGGRNAVAQAWTGSTTTIKTAVGGTIQSIATGANPLVTMASAHNLAVAEL